MPVPLSVGSRTVLRNRDIQEAMLPNGIRVVTELMPHVRSVSMGIWIGTGSRRETADENGISHFIEHMVFKGTANRSAEEIARSVDSIGGGLDAFTSKELVSYNTKVLDEHVPLAFDVLSDLVLHPLFEEADIEKEKGVILEEIKMEVDNPEYLIHEIFSSNFWKDHPLGKPILGTRENVKRFSRPQIRGYYERVYAPGNILITAAGNLDHEKLVRIAEERFSGLSGDGIPSADEAPNPHARLVFRNKSSLEQVHVYMGVPAYPFPHESRFICYVLNTVLGGGMSSRLFQNIREKQGLVYSVYSELNTYRDAGCLAICAATSIESARKVVTTVMDELRQIREEPVSAEEVRRAKDHLKGSFMLGLESTSSRMGNLARQQLYFGRFFSLDEMLDSIEAVTADQVQAVANELLQPKNVALTMLGNLEGFKMTREELVS
jgi:predicted Zn-dependent peptidase